MTIFDNVQYHTRIKWLNMFQFCVVWHFLSIYSQMATSVVEAIIQHHSEDSSSHLGWNGSNLVGYCFLKSFKIWGRIWNTLDLRYPHRKKSQGVKSGERGCHSISPCKETTYPENMPLMISSEQRDVCADAPSRWNQRFSAQCV